MGLWWNHLNLGICKCAVSAPPSLHPSFLSPVKSQHPAKIIVCALELLWLQNSMHINMLHLVAGKNTINLISVLTTWWCPCVQSSLVLDVLDDSNKDFICPLYTKQSPINCTHLTVIICKCLHNMSLRPAPFSCLLPPPTQGAIMIKFSEDNLS